MRSRAAALFPLSLSLSLVACSSSSASVTIDVTLGHEADAMTIAPAITRLDVELVSADGTIDAKASAAPGGTFDLGTQPGGTYFTVELTGVAADGTKVARGRSSAGISLDSVSGGIPVFLERLGGFSRPPGALPASRSCGVAGVVAERYLLTTGGAAADPKGGEIYDLFTLSGTSTTADFPRAAASMIAVGTGLALFDAKGATNVDLSAGTTSDIPAPNGLAYADVAGGAVITGGDGRTFVVGATKTTPTKSVLVLGTDGTFSAISLTHARAGAATAWVDKIGLVIAGGSPTAPGVEVLAPTSTTFATKPFPPDATTGAGAAIATTGALVLAGGVDAKGAAAPTRTLDLGCASACAPKIVAGAALGAATKRAWAYALPGARVLVIAQAMDDATRPFRIDLGASSIVELPLREPRRCATPVPSPNGTLAILGGAHLDGSPALTVEQLFPE